MWTCSIFFKNKYSVFSKLKVEQTLKNLFCTYTFEKRNVVNFNVKKKMNTMSTYFSFSLILLTKMIENR